MRVVLVTIDLSPSLSIELVGLVQLIPPPPSFFLATEKLHILYISDKGHVSMGVISDGNSYGIPEGLIFGFPVTCNHGSWEMVEVGSLTLRTMYFTPFSLSLPPSIGGGHFCCTPTPREYIYIYISNP